MDEESGLRVMHVHEFFGRVSAVDMQLHCAVFFGQCSANRRPTFVLEPPHSVRIGRMSEVAEKNKALLAVPIQSAMSHCIGCMRVDEKPTEAKHTGGNAEILGEQFALKGGKDQCPIRAVDGAELSQNVRMCSGLEFFSGDRWALLSQAAKKMEVLGVENAESIGAGRPNSRAKLLFSDEAIKENNTWRQLFDPVIEARVIQENRMSADSARLQLWAACRHATVLRTRRDMHLKSGCNQRVDQLPIACPCRRRLRLRPNIGNEQCAQAQWWLLAPGCGITDFTSAAAIAGRNRTKSKKKKKNNPNAPRVHPQSYQVGK